MSEVQIITILVLVLLASMYMVFLSFAHIIMRTAMFLGSCSLCSNDKNVTLRLEFSTYKVFAGIVGFAGILFTIIKLATM